MTTPKFDFDAPDCTCPYSKGIVARNMCGHVPPCPVYERWHAMFYGQQIAEMVEAAKKNVSSLDDELAAIYQVNDLLMGVLQTQAVELLHIKDTLLKRAVAAAGCKWCEKCDGTGAIERLDSGYMRRFGLREWDGCKACGGDGNEVRGKGYTKP